MIVKRIKRFFSRLREKINEINGKLNLNSVMNADNLAMLQIEGLSDDIGYIPFTEYSLSPYTIAHILNDIIINDRKTIVEFGSGTSSIYISKLIKSNNLDAYLYSIDHDKNWQELLNVRYLNDSKQVVFVHAPLVETKNGVLESQKWYDEIILKEVIQSNKKVDLIIVDGPPGDVSDFARYPAINFIINNLSDTGAVLIDDTHREYEIRIVKDLVKKYGFISNKSMRHNMLTRGVGFNTNPIGRI